jgi:tRNA (mo5U34)-methyltransferase
MLREYFDLLRFRGRLLRSTVRASKIKRLALAREIQDLGPWFHNYEIASGIWTNPNGEGAGADYVARRWGILQNLLPDVRGKSCLDVGCSSGFFSLKLKELGAQFVVGVDHGEQLKAIEQARFAARELHLDIDFRNVSVYELQELQRTFDVVLCMGVLYHLRHPMLALERLRAVCSGTLILQTITTNSNSKIEEISPELLASTQLQSQVLEQPGFPALRFVEGALNGDSSCWFLPNPPAVLAMMRSSGFRVEQVVLSSPHEIFVQAVAV